MLDLEERRQTVVSEAVPITFPLLRTKLEPPRLGDGLVLRPHLIERLDEGLKRPLTLVRAPAAYGKSTLVGQWLGRQEASPAAWVWLDGDDNELERFVAYLVAAVQRIFPGSCQRTRSLLLLPLTIPVELLVSTLLNELNALSHPFVLVLEEYEAICLEAIHRFVSQLVEYQPPHLHLVLVSRVTPPLPLARLRERRVVSEIGVGDLRLTVEEAVAILEHAADHAVDETEAAALHAQTEGWVGGLHLAATSNDAKRHLGEFFLAEVLARQPLDIQQLLLESSLLEGICPALLAEVCTFTSSPGAAERLLRHLQSASLFLCDQKDRPGWYRYHGLFREALRQELAQRRGRDEMAMLHRQAAAWLGADGEIEAALGHWLAAGEQQAAANLVEDQVADALAAEAFPALARWLGRLPAELKRQRPALLLAEAWVEQARLLWPDLEPKLSAVQDLLENNGAVSPSLKAGVAALYSNLWYWQGDAARSQAVVQQACNDSPTPDSYTTAYALARVALSQQMAGAEEEALQELESAWQRPGLLPGARAQLLLARALVHLSGGRLHEAERSARMLKRLAEENGLRGSSSWARYLLGRIYYQWDRLEEAAVHYQAVVDDAENAEALPLHDSHLGLALIYETKGERQVADETVDALQERFWERGALFVPATGSFRARLALQRGEIATAARQAAQFVSTQNGQGLLPLEIPALTRVRALIARNTAASLKEAMDALRPLQRVAQATHNRACSVELLALRALVLEAQGDMETALDALRQALTLAERGGMIRTFVDLGPPMAALLYRLTTSEPAQAYAGELLAAFPRSPQPVLLSRDEQAVDRMEALTDREWEVLRLMGQRLSNKEIAQRLIISPYTVKKHASNIYGKLDVNSRRQAVARARQLGLLSSPDSGGPFLALA